MSYFYAAANFTTGNTPPVPPGLLGFPQIAPIVSSNFSHGNYIYHQANDSAFTELKYDTLTKTWSSTAVWLGSLPNGTLSTTAL